MQLRELVKEIRRKKNWTQVELAANLGVLQQTIQKMENSGANQEKLFAVILKLLPLCDEMGLELYHRGVNEAELEILDQIVQEVWPVAGADVRIRLRQFVFKRMDQKLDEHGHRPSKVSYVPKNNDGKDPPPAASHALSGTKRHTARAARHKR